jgi:hypothetical protein
LVLLWSATSGSSSPFNPPRRADVAWKHIKQRLRGRKLNI